MAWDFITMVVTAEMAPLARGLAAGLTPAGAGMFETALSPTGQLPATHFVPSGAIEPEFTNMISSAESLFGAASAAGSLVTLEQCQALVGTSVVSTEGPFQVFEAMGLQIVMEGEENA